MLPHSYACSGTHRTTTTVKKVCKNPPCSIVASATVWSTPTRLVQFACFGIIPPVIKSYYCAINLLFTSPGGSPVIAVGTSALLLRTSATVPGQNIAITLPQGDVVDTESWHILRVQPPFGLIGDTTKCNVTHETVWQDFLKASEDKSLSLCNSTQASK